MTPIMTFEQFQATGRDSEDLHEDLGVDFCGDSPAKGRIYLDALYIEAVAPPQGGWALPSKRWALQWALQLGNQDWLSDDLVDLEGKLYDYACCDGFAQRPFSEWKKLAAAARPIDDNECGSNRQIAAENRFNIQADIAFPVVFAEDSAYSRFAIKATSDERIDESLRLIAKAMAAEIDDLDEAMALIQEAHDITDGGVAALFWSGRQEDWASRDGRPELIEQYLDFEHRHTPLWKREFPDFKPAEMPDIPEGWEDQSWHNDTCPSFLANGLRVFIDYADPAQRELPDTPRFSVSREPTEAENYTHDAELQTDDWSEVLRFVEQRLLGGA